MYTWSFEIGPILFHGTLEEVFEEIRRTYGENVSIRFTEHEKLYRIQHGSVITYVIGI